MHDAETLYRIIAKDSNEIEQLIANLFPDEFPHYPDDWPGGGPEGNRCVGEHIPISMVMRLVEEYTKLNDIFSSISSHGKVTIDARSKMVKGKTLVQVKTGDKILTGASVVEALAKLKE